ncbi:MAG: fructose 1,6-bisphosphatase [Deltaproteobacteria bacterium]|nr:fructose 1,6-bisphosphatase [Deltaproteobacteria bacterium]
MMRTTLSIIKADTGSIGGHIKPNNPFWDYVRDKVARKALELREQGFSGAAMLPYSELEYGGIVERLERLNKLFTVREQ